MARIKVAKSDVYLADYQDHRELSIEHDPDLDIITLKNADDDLYTAGRSISMYPEELGALLEMIDHNRAVLDEIAKGK